MPHHLLPICLALLSALCIAVGAVVRQRAAAAVPVSEVADVMSTVARQPAWWLGITVGVAGYAFQAAALARGSLLLVQPLLVLSLLFALPIGAWYGDRMIKPREWAWAATLTVAVAILVVVGDPRHGAEHAEALHWALVAAFGVPALGACLLAARAWPGHRRALLLGVVAGALFGVAAVLTKGVMATARHGGLAVLLSPETWALVVVGVAALCLQQSAYQAGDLQASLPASTVAEPVVASMLGFLVLGEYLDVDKELTALLLAALVAMVVAAVALARGTGEAALA
ncbi:hypothetical protein FOS14_11560 [Skermania sp. ID1734]|uniref:DMT family transporter n=1 Tax=Skermania sp. ID1734 TaxID=2597516 RepID=UPI00117CD70E|nr:DMT family transporter [Skermania sp. ID1734]TSD99424.1 hypothetical protein FOS14_11560 [Skermania sp. ID1734]